MAITILKRPDTFFNCTNPVIFEFTTDATIGNFDDYVCDIVINSAYSSKSAVIRNVFPNTSTKVFSVDTSEFLKALQLSGFNFEFEGTKNFAIEKFALSIMVRDGSQPNSEIFSFDDYYFDNLVFTDGLSTVDSTEEGVYSILGERLLIDSFDNQLVEDKLTFLAPDTIEVCDAFDNYVSIFVNELTGNTVTVGGVSGAITNIDGVATYQFTAGQLSQIKSLVEITCSNQNLSRRIAAYPYKGGDCSKVVQFRYFNRFGGFSFFYARLEGQNDTRSGVTFYDNNYFNEDENRSGVAQSTATYQTVLTFEGSKQMFLKDTFSDLLRSPKVEMNLKQINGNDLFIECEVTGSSADQYLTFDFNLSATIKNSGNFRL